MTCGNICITKCVFIRGDGMGGVCVVAVVVGFGMWESLWMTVHREFLMQWAHDVI